MKVFKDNHPLQYVQEFLEDEAQKCNFIKQYLKPLLHGGLKTMLKSVKSKGFSPLDVFTFLMLLPLMGVSTVGGFVGSSQSNLIACGKDVFYRFRNCSLIPWRAILYSVARRFRKLVEKKGGSFEATTPKCLIFDDTVLPKTGKKIEFMGKVWDHVKNCSVLGSKLLVMGHWDGKSMIPLDFSIHREKGKKKNKPFGMTFTELASQWKKNRQDDTPSVERIEELDQKKTDVVLKMIKKAIKMGFKADFVLTDSWFFSEKLLKLVTKKGMHLISMAKMGKITFSFKKKDYSPKALLQANKYNAKYCRKLKIHYINLIVSYKGITISLFFVKYGRKDKWHLLTCSNTKLSFLKVMEIYQIRWSIEVFFKETKQHLGLSSCQANDFDAHISHVSICLMLYTALSLKKRFDQQESIGKLFQRTKEELFEHNFAHKIWEFFLKLMQKLAQVFEIEPVEFMKQVFCLHTNNPFFQTLLKALT